VKAKPSTTGVPLSYAGKRQFIFWAKRNSSSSSPSPL